jgi:hypothetical protein
MDEFSTFIFKENELKTNNKRVIKERAYLIGILIGLIGFVLYLLDLEYSTPILLTGVAILTIGRITMSGKDPSIGHRPLELRLKNDLIIIGKEKIEIKDKANILINVIGYRGQGINQRTAFYKTYSGNDNTIRLWYNDKEVLFNFILDSEHQKDKLLNFCETNGFKVQQ